VASSYSCRRRWPKQKSISANAEDGVSGRVGPIARRGGGPGGFRDEAEESDLRVGRGLVAPSSDCRGRPATTGIRGPGKQRGVGDTQGSSVPPCGPGSSGEIEIDLRITRPPPPRSGSYPLRRVDDAPLRPRHPAAAFAGNRGVGDRPEVCLDPAPTRRTPGTGAGRTMPNARVVPASRAEGGVLPDPRASRSRNPWHRAQPRRQCPDARCRRVPEEDDAPLAPRSEVPAEGIALASVHRPPASSGGPALWSPPSAARRSTGP